MSDFTKAEDKGRWEELIRKNRNNNKILIKDDKVAS